MSIHFNQAHRKVYGEKSIEFALVTIAGLFITRIVSGEKITTWFLILEFELFAFACIVSYYFLKGVKEVAKL